MDSQNVRCLEDRHLGETAYVLQPGLGTAILKAHQVGSGPVIAIDDAARELGRLGRDGGLYVLQHGAPVFPDLDLIDATLITTPRLAKYRLECKERIVLASVDELQGKRPCTLTPDAAAELVAIELARLMGCAEVVLIGFDAGLNEAGRFCRYDQPHSASVDRLRYEAVKLQLRGLPARFYSAMCDRFVPLSSSELTVITATGDRPLTLAMCRWWIMHQSLLPGQWIIVDDGREPVPPDVWFAADYVYRQPEAPASGQTLTKNLLLALQRVRYPKVVVMEDDDWYHADYLRVMDAALDLYSLVGQGEAVYYHYPSAMWYRHPNLRHASLSQTAFTTEAAAVLTEVCAQADTPYVDMALWKHLPNKRRVLPGSPPLSIGMKGLPGRHGLGFGHAPDHKFLPDPDGRLLRGFIGDDYAVYEECLGPAHAPHVVVEELSPPADGQ